MLDQGYVQLPEFTFQYVSINTENDLVFLKNSFAFTFQYVSINTIWNEWFRDENLHLHSNMFLLILSKSLL